MRILTVALFLSLSSVAIAQEAIPDLRGTWIGKSKAVVFGHNQYHPGGQKPGDPPRIREVEFTIRIDGQDGRVLWGEAWASANPEAKDTLALAIAADGKTIIGADNDGAHYMTIVDPDHIERC